jgi:hypothetical protein
MGGMLVVGITIVMVQIMRHCLTDCQATDSQQTQHQQDR